MGNSVKRPWSVWIAQIFFVYCVSMWFLGLFMAMMTTPQAEPSFAGIFSLVLMGVLFNGPFVIAFWGMAERKTWGRWLGVALLVFMIVFASFSKAVLPGPAENTAGIVLRILLCVLLFVVILHISLSEKADAFFPKKVGTKLIDHPPPPPTFDD